MKNPMSLSLFRFVLAFAAILAASVSQAETFPDRPIHFVVPYAAGGGVDIVARIVAEKMSVDLGQPIIVENRVGGGGILGTDYVARSAPDGYTFAVVTSGHTILPSLTNLPWDPVADFAPVSMVVSYPLLLVVNPSVPANSIADFVALAKAKPGALNYGTGGVGTPPQLAMELFKSMTGTNILHIPYRGNGLATAALLSGEIQAMLDTMVGPLPSVRAGKLRALGVSSLIRSSLLPDVPTISEAGVPGYQFEGWTGMFAPRGTPQEIVDRVNAALVRALAVPGIAPHLIELGYVPVGNSPEAFGKTVSTEITKIAKIVKDAGIPRMEP
jgi:tripartite-type tricarboxylate transporter receptor subunit TctC